ncbi:MAG: hypothetical protein HOO92_13620 [Methylococcaceae bacterium]|nr:hypothetical protein [Methylococcaceae bacterium]
MKNKKLVTVFLVILLTPFVLSRAYAEEECKAESKWFPKTPMDLSLKLDPKDDCGFYKWAWQTFLYVMQTGKKNPDTPRFLKFDTPSTLFGSNATPQFFSLAFDKIEHDNILLLTPRVAKDKDPIDVEDILQADNGIVIDQSGRPLYYASHLNNTYFEFIDSNGYTAPENVKNAPPTQEFPRGTLELKSSWKVVSNTETESTHFITTAKLPWLKNGLDGKLEIDRSKDAYSAKVALVGLHIVGVIDGHPEFVWATFEHSSNTPPVNFKPEDDWEKHKEEVIDPVNNWTFYAKGTPYKDCNIKGKNTLKLADIEKQTFNPPFTQICRTFKIEDPAVISLNKDVKEKLKDSVLKNYELEGGVWFNQPDKDFKEGLDFSSVFENGKNQNGEVVYGGEINLTNSTMETFTQGTPQQNKNAPQNCFGCHTTDKKPVRHTNIQFPAIRLGVSHFLVNSFAYPKQIEIMNLNLEGLAKPTKTNEISGSKKRK